MIKDRHNTIAVVLVILFGFMMYYVGTDGFRAFTFESAKKYELIQNKPVFPSVTLEDSEGRSYKFNEFADGKYVFATFMYTSCTTVCPIIGMNMAKVYHRIPSEYIGKDIVFLSISFDPARDDPKTLAKYRTYFGSDGETWRMARVNDQAELDLLLKSLGVIAIPDGKGDFTHSTNFYLIGKKGHLLEVMDYTDIEGAANTVMKYLGDEARE